VSWTKEKHDKAKRYLDSHDGVFGLTVTESREVMAEIERLWALLAAADRARAGWASEIERLRQQSEWLDKAHSHVEECETIIKQLESERDNLRRENQRLSAELTALREVIGQLKSEVREASYDGARLREENGRLKESAKAWEERFFRHKESLDGD
jgi:chromosome segregation ATPase